ncbi:MAG: SCP2 sterol-binding domain-containing protein [Deltaproteobacteria bacterium]|nr:SCP2 sterol-binding domain-containing protein [Deltaproteobacteria bacterium]MBW2418948.1 SCP2 sterol-binding domain-containing protein [Deltaproteobacteria bacterium]
MAEFPVQPVSPEEFLEDFVPRSLRRFQLPAEARRRTLKLGLRLDGKGGGEWRFDIEHGHLRVRPGSRVDASITVVQRVQDWRGAMWDGRGGVVGRGVISVLEHGPDSKPGRRGRSRRILEVLDQLAGLNAVVRVVVTGGLGGDWWVGFKLGPGRISPKPDVTLSLSAEDAEALLKGDLDLVWAVMGGKLGLSGDKTLMLRLQSIAKQLG